MLASAHRCRVCGWRGADDVCPKCGTVLLQGRALCRRCGKVFEGPIAICDECGGTISPPPEPEDDAAIERLTHLPGVSKATAAELHRRGFRDPSEVLRLALPDRAVRLGVHRTLARKVTLEELRPVRHFVKTVACPTCGAPRKPSDARCPACDSPWDREPNPEEMRKAIAEVAGEIHDLAADPDFRGLPEEMREEILEAVEGAGFPLETENEFAQQFQEWKARGFDTAELERILREEGSDVFKATFVRVIRSQLLKRRDQGRFQCPLCESDVPPTAEECENCGAKFS